MVEFLICMNERYTRVQQFVLGANTPHIKWIVGMDMTPGPNVSITYLHSTHMLNERFVVRCGLSKNKHQKDTCSYDIGLCAPIL